MQIAEMSKRKFEAIRNGAQVIEANTIIPDAGGVDSLQNQKVILDKFLNEQNIRNPQYKALKIPRRPHWTKEMSKTEIT
jgi:hypothetical protein